MPDLPPRGPLVPPSAGGATNQASWGTHAPEPWGPVGAVLFDLDDTLLDAETAWRSGVVRLVADHVPAPLDAEAALAAWDAVFPTWFDAYLLGELTLEQSRAGRVRDWGRLLDVAVPEGAELDWFESYLEGYRAGWSLFPEVPGMLAALAGLRIGIVTNGDSVQQREKVVGLGLDGIVDVVVVSSEVGAAKPDPRMLLVAAERLGVPPSACLMVGDRLDRDVAAALAAGMRAIWVRRSQGPEADRLVPAGLVGRFVELGSLADLPALVHRGRVPA